MITVDYLKRSQKSRPRHVIVLFGVFALILMVPLVAIFAWCVLPNSALMQEWAQYDSFLPGVKLDAFMFYYGFPVLTLTIGMLPFIVLRYMCKFRPVYWWLGVPAWIVFILIDLATTVLYLLMFVPGLLEFVLGLMPAEVQPTFMEIYSMTATIYVYVALGYAALLLISSIFAVLYCVNYPAKYEEIYTRRKARLRAYPNYKDQEEFRIRFYESYKHGDWNQMMLDLCFEELTNKNEPLSKEMIAFMAEYAGYGEGKVKEATFARYAARGEYERARKSFLATVRAKQAVENGARVVLPDERRPAPQKPVKPKPVEPKPYVPPLRPAREKGTDPSSTKWRPEEIA